MLCMSAHARGGKQKGFSLRTCTCMHRAGRPAALLKASALSAGCIPYVTSLNAPTAPLQPAAVCLRGGVCCSEASKTHMFTSIDLVASSELVLLAGTPRAQGAQAPPPVLASYSLAGGAFTEAGRCPVAGPKLNGLACLPSSQSFVTGLCVANEAGETARGKRGSKGGVMGCRGVWAGNAWHWATGTLSKCVM